MLTDRDRERDRDRDLIGVSGGGGGSGSGRHGDRADRDALMRDERAREREDNTGGTGGVSGMPAAAEGTATGGGGTGGGSAGGVRGGSGDGGRRSKGSTQRDRAMASVSCCWCKLRCLVAFVS